MFVTRSVQKEIEHFDKLINLQKSRNKNKKGPMKPFIEEFSSKERGGLTGRPIAQSDKVLLLEIRIVGRF